MGFMSKEKNTNEDLMDYILSDDKPRRVNTPISRIRTKRKR